MVPTIAWGFLGTLLLVLEDEQKENQLNLPECISQNQSTSQPNQAPTCATTNSNVKTQICAKRTEKISERSPGKKASPPQRTTSGCICHPRQKEKETNTSSQTSQRTAPMLCNDLKHKKTSTNRGIVPHQGTNQKWKRRIGMGIDLWTFRHQNKSPSTTPKTFLPSQWVNIHHGTTQVPNQWRLNQPVCPANPERHSRHQKFNRQWLYKISPTTSEIQDPTWRKHSAPYWPGSHDTRLQKMAWSHYNLPIRLTPQDLQIPGKTLPSS